MKKIIFFSLCFILCLSLMINPVFASESYPDITDIVSNSDGYILYKNTYSGHIFLYTYTLSEGYNSSDYNFHFHERENDGLYVEVRHITNNTQGYFDFEGYLLEKGAWDNRYHSTLDKEKHIDPFIHVEPLEASHNVYDRNGDVFFQVPLTVETLAEKIQGITNQEMETTQITVVGTMKVLALCGVGCLALLITLNLFGKVFNRYR